MTPRFIRVPKSGGGTATIRCDAVTAMIPNTTKDGREETMIQLGPTLIIHTSLSEADICRRLGSATGLPPHIADE